MTRFWESMSDERAELLVKGWGTVPTESLRSAVMDVARRVDRSGRPFEALGLLSAGCESTSNPSAVADLAMLAAEVAANCSKPLTANAAIRLARDATREAGDALGPDWCLVQGHALGGEHSRMAVPSWSTRADVAGGIKCWLVGRPRRRLDLRDDGRAQRDRRQRRL